MKEIDQKNLAEVSGGAMSTGRPAEPVSPPPFNPNLPTDPIEGPSEAQAS